MDFDLIANNWDTKRRIDRAKIISNKIKETISLNRGYSALDFGCGTGLISFNLHSEFKSIDLIDNSKGMIKTLKEKIADSNISNMNPIYLDLTQNLELGKKYDVIYSSMVFHHINDVNEIVGEFERHLNGNGTLCIVDLNIVSKSFHKKESDFIGHHGFDVKELEEILITNNFIKITANSFYHSEKKVDDEIIPYSLFIMKAIKKKQ